MATQAADKPYVPEASKLNDLYKAMDEAVKKRDRSAQKKLGAEIDKLENAGKLAAEEAQKGERETFVKDATLMLTGDLKIPRDAITVSVTAKRTDTGFDDWSANIGVPGLLDLVHSAMADVKVPSTVNGFTFQDGTVTLTGKRAGGGGGGGAGHTWFKNGESMRLGAAFDKSATATEKAEHDAAETGGKQWSIKVRVVKAAGYTQ